MQGSMIQGSPPSEDPSVPRPLGARPPVSVDYSDWLPRPVRGLLELTTFRFELDRAGPLFLRLDLSSSHPNAQLFVGERSRTARWRRSRATFPLARLRRSRGAAFEAGRPHRRRHGAASVRVTQLGGSAPDLTPTSSRAFSYRTLSVDGGLGGLNATPPSS